MIMHIIVPNFAKIDRTVPKIWQILDFSRWRPSAISDFEKLEILTSGPVRRPDVRHSAKCREDWSKRSGDMADFRFFKMAAVRHLHLFYACWDHPRRVFGGLCDCAKFGCNR